MRRILDTPPSLLQSLDDSYALCAGCRYEYRYATDLDELRLDGSKKGGGGGDGEESMSSDFG